MPQATTLTINDGAPTPVSHVFVPSRRDAGQAVFRSETGSTTLATREELTVKVREGSATVAPKVSIKLDLPIEGVVDGQTKTVREYLGGIDFVIAPTGTAAERKARRILLANTLLNVEVGKVIDNVEAFY